MGIMRKYYDKKFAEQVKMIRSLREEVWNLRNEVKELKELKQQVEVHKMLFDELKNYNSSSLDYMRDQFYEGIIKINELERRQTNYEEIEKLAPKMWAAINKVEKFPKQVKKLEKEHKALCDVELRNSERIDLIYAATGGR